MRHRGYRVKAAAYGAISVQKIQKNNSKKIKSKYQVVYCQIKKTLFRRQNMTSVYVSF